MHGFVWQSGGRLEITSAPGRGTAVRMLFPAASGDAEAPPRSKAEAMLDAKGGTETVLAVDDDRGVLDLAVHHLTALGYRVLSAGGGEEALGVLGRTQGRVNLLFTDIAMPGGGFNGLVLAERARALRPGLRVLFATGYSDDLVVRGTPTPGNAAVLAKPYRRADLAERVRAALDRRDGRPDPGPAREA